ncbi:formin-like protein 4 [Mangifera indica]|uniref:formin-like protein 4 n=1 Tax=Mangifera indica TaxID=29780 RepID=UPI001CF9E018|nr:formin-like protein 4 [Mangifera indica]
MAAKLLPWFLLLHIFVYVIPFSSSQPQNIETSFPIDIPAPTAAPNSPTNPLILSPPQESPQLQPPPPLPPPPESNSSSNQKTVVKAVAATAASTIVVSAVFFFVLQKYFIARRRRDKVVNVSPPGNSPQGGRLAALPPNEFTKFDGNVRGLIVDENGLDVLYWRKLEEGDNNQLRSFEKEVLQGPPSSSDGGKLDETMMNKPDEIQEVPLLSLRGSSSSSSYNSIRPEENYQDPVMASEEPPASVSFKTIGEKEPPVQPSTPPPPSAPPLPSQNNNRPSPPPPPPGTKNPGPPLPPPPGKKNPGPPLPPPPGKKNPGPPLPPPPGKKNPSPPPPPPQAGGLRTSLNPSTEGKVRDSSAAGNGQVKLKPLHWDKLNKNAEKSMVWDKIDNGSFRFDGDLMEALFGYVATDRKSPPRTNDSRNPKSPNSQTIILDARKSQNTAIVLKSMALSQKELINALKEGKGLNTETLEKLDRIAPTKEEQSEIIKFEGDPTRLADGEAFHFHILKAIPSAYTRLHAMLFRSNYDTEILHLKESIQTLELGCRELRNRGLFMKLLEAILKAGNRMNAGTSRGNAQAFNLTALRKLSDVKSTDGKTTLLHFVVEEVVRAEGRRCVNTNNSLSRGSSRSSINSDYSTPKEDKEKEYITLGLPVVGGLSAEFSNVIKAATIDYETFSSTCSSLSARATENRELVSECSADGREGFVKEMKGFLEAAEIELKVVREEQTRVMQLVGKTAEYYQTEAAKKEGAHHLQLFVIIKDFLGMVDQVCVEIARNLQRRRALASGIGSPPGLRTVRFPKLSEHFLTDKSRSNSVESDSDSD